MVSTINYSKRIGCKTTVKCIINVCIGAGLPGDRALLYNQIFHSQPRNYLLRYRATLPTFETSQSVLGFLTSLMGFHQGYDSYLNWYFTPGTKAFLVH